MTAAAAHKLVRLRTRREQYVARLRLLDRASALVERNLADLQSLWELDQLLINAAIAGNAREVARRLREGADPDARDADGDPVLLLAASRDGNLAVVRELLAAGADVNAPDALGNTPLIAAVRDENLAIVKELTRGGAELDVSNLDGDTPLTNAATWGARKVVRHLLSAGADPALRDGNGLSAAELATQQGHLKLAAILSPR